MDAPGSRESIARLEGEVATLARRVRHVINERAHAVHTDLSPTAYLLLSHIGDQGPVRASDIAWTFESDKGALSRQIARLTAMGLLEKSRDPRDGRAWLVTLTRVARTALTDQASERSERFAARLHDWTSHELDTLSHFLTRFNEDIR